MGAAPSDIACRLTADGGPPVTSPSASTRYEAGGRASTAVRPPRGALLLLSCATLLSGCEPRPTVVLGVATSGPFVDAARMAVEEELAVAPLPGFDTVMIPQSRSIASPAIEAARRLAEVEGLIAVVGHSNSAASLAAAPIYNDLEVVQIAPTASAPVFSGAGPYSFRLVQSDDRQAIFLTDHLQEMLPGGGRVAVAYVNDTYGRGLRAAVVSTLDAQRFRVVAELPHLEGDVGESDAAYVADALSVARPDVVLWLARGSVLARFIGPIRTALPEVPIVGGDAVATGAVTGAPPETLGEVHFVEYVDLDATEALRAFKTRYRARFGRDPGGPEALTYDAVRLVVAGVRAGARTGPELRRYLVSLGRGSPPHAGLTGPIVFDENGDVERTYVLSRVGEEPER